MPDRISTTDGASTGNINSGFSIPEGAYRPPVTSGNTHAFSKFFFDIDKNFSSLPETVGLWERDKHKTKQGFRGNNHAHCKTKIALALGILALTAQAQADQLADIKAAGVVKVATFDANPPFGSVDRKPTSWWVMMSISPGAGKIAWGKTGAGSHQPGQPDSAAAIREGRPDRRRYHHHPGTRTGH